VYNDNRGKARLSSPAESHRNMLAPSFIPSDCALLS
jgi:hypothetical protein